MERCQTPGAASYLRNAINKMEQFQYSSRVIAQSILDEGKVVLTTCDEDVLQNPRTDDQVVRTEYPLSPCSHEVLDTRVMLHAAIASSQGYKRILIVANDTDIIVLGISLFAQIGAEKLRVSFGAGKSLGTFLSITSAIPCLLPKHSSPRLHALTGCDNITFFLAQ